MCTYVLRALACQRGIPDVRATVSPLTGPAYKQRASGTAASGYKLLPNSLTRLNWKVWLSPGEVMWTVDSYQLQILRPIPIIKLTFWLLAPTDKLEPVTDRDLGRNRAQVPFLSVYYKLERFLGSGAMSTLPAVVPCSEFVRSSACFRTFVRFLAGNDATETPW